MAFNETVPPENFSANDEHASDARGPSSTGCFPAEAAILVQHEWLSGWLPLGATNEHRRSCDNCCQPRYRGRPMAHWSASIRKSQRSRADPTREVSHRRNSSNGEFHHQFRRAFRCTECPQRRRTGTCESDEVITAFDARPPGSWTGFVAICINRAAAPFAHTATQSHSGDVWAARAVFIAVNGPKTPDRPPAEQPLREPALRNTRAGSFIRSRDEFRETVVWCEVAPTRPKTFDNGSQLNRGARTTVPSSHQCFGFNETI